MRDGNEDHTPSFYFVEGFPRIVRDGEPVKWVEIFPGLRLWWYEHTYTDEELLEYARNREHYYAIRWSECRVKRMNGGVICELEINPTETREFFLGLGIEVSNSTVFTPHQLMNIFYSLSLHLNGYNSQMKISCSLNMSWQHIAHTPELYPLEIDFEGEYNLHQWWQKNTDAIKEIKLEVFDGFRIELWKSAIALCTDSSGRYAEFLMQYGLAMQKDGSLERIIGYFRAIESLFNIPRNISPNLKKYCRLLVHPLYTDPNFIFTVEEYSYQPSKENLEEMNKIITKGWEIRNRVAHGQEIKEKHWDKAMDILLEIPVLLHWLNRGVAQLGYLPLRTEFESREFDEFFEWNEPLVWDNQIIWEQYRNHIYRYDKSHHPNVVQLWTESEHNDYLEFSNSIDISNFQFEAQAYYQVKRDMNEP